VRAGLQDDRVAVGDAPVDEDGIVARAAERRHRSQLEVGVVAPQVVLGREVDLLLAGAEQLAELARVDAAVAGNNDARVTVGCGDDDRLGDVGGREPERLRLGARALRVRVRQQLVRDAGLVEHPRQVLGRHGPDHRRYSRSSKMC
jgi:hypothetical protein